MESHPSSGGLGAGLTDRGLSRVSGPEVVADEGATLTERDGYEHGVPCWVDTWQEDPDTAATFYAGVFGWDVEKVTPPGTDTRYYMCRLRGSDVAAIRSPPPAGMPPAWATYVWVDDADAVAASAVKAGGSLVAEPFGSLDGGRMGIVACRRGWRCRGTGCCSGSA